MIILKSQLSEILINIYCANVFDGGEIFHFYFPTLTLSWRRSLSYRNTSIDLPFRLVDWFLYDRDFRHGRVKFGSFWIYLKSVFFWLVCECKKLKVFIFLQLEADKGRGEWVEWATTFKNNFRSVKVLKLFSYEYCMNECWMNESLKQYSAGYTPMLN